jgi:hypothetical protein
VKVASAATLFQAQYADDGCNAEVDPSLRPPLMRNKPPICYNDKGRMNHDRQDALSIMTESTCEQFEKIGRMA